MRDLSSLHQEISLLSKNLEKTVNDMKVQNRNVDLLHENINILQHELAQKNEIIKSLMEIQSTLFDSLSVRRNNQLSQINQKTNIINNNNNNLRNCWSTIKKQFMNSTETNTTKSTHKIYNYRNNNCKSNK